MAFFVDQLTNKLVDCNIIASNDRELYRYGFEQGAFMLLNLLTTVVTGWLMGMLWQSILLMLAYIPLRSNAGGYHASTPLRCYLLTTATIAAVLPGIRLLCQSPLLCSMAAVAGTVVIWQLAPVEDKNKPLDVKEIAVYGRRTRVRLCCYAAVVALGLCMGWQNVPATITAALVMLGAMVVWGKRKNETNPKSSTKQ